MEAVRADPECSKPQFCSLIRVVNAAMKARYDHPHQNPTLFTSVLTSANTLNSNAEKIT